MAQKTQLAKYLGESTYPKLDGSIGYYKSWQFIGLGVGDITMSDQNLFKLQDNGNNLFSCDLISTDSNDEFDGNLYGLDADTKRIFVGKIVREIEDNDRWYHANAIFTDQNAAGPGSTLVSIYQSLINLEIECFG